ncbi:MAG: hypothetical protein HQM11_10545 [SAR324 cluster bacterium]|nr:hypothetical protein [SAR324 cluster bacterium]
MLIIFCLSGLSVLAQTPNIRFNGFATLAYVRSDSEVDYYRAEPMNAGINDQGNMDRYSRYGLQLNVEMSPQTDFTIQVTGQGEHDYQDRYQPHVDWLYVRRQVTDNFQIKLGRLRMPNFLYSDTMLVGYTYPWLMPPDEAYMTVPISSIEALDLLYTMQIKDYTFQIQAGVGTGESWHEQNPSNGISTSIDWGNMKQSEYFQFQLSSDSLTARLGISHVLWDEVYVNANPDGSDLHYLKDAAVNFNSEGLRYDDQNFMFIMERTQFTVDETNLQNYYVNVVGVYATAGYYISPEWQAHLTYSTQQNYDIYINAVDKNKTFLIKHQNTKILGVRHELDQGVSLKLEYRSVEVPDETAEATGFANRGHFLGAVDGAVNMYGLGVDVVF